MPPKKGASPTKSGKNSPKTGGKGGKSPKGGSSPISDAPPPRIPVYKSARIPASHNHEKVIELEQKLRQIFASYDRINTGRLSIADAEQAARAAGLFLSSDDGLAFFDNLQQIRDVVVTPGIPQEVFVKAVLKAILVQKFPPDALPEVRKSLGVFRNPVSGQVEWDSLKQALTTAGHAPLTNEEAEVMFEDFVDEKKNEFRELKWLRELYENKLSVAWPPHNPAPLLKQNPFTLP